MSAAVTMLDAVFTMSASALGNKSVTNDSMVGIAVLIAPDNASVPATTIGAGGVGKTRPPSLVPAAPKPAGSTASGSAIAESLLGGVGKTRPPSLVPAAPKPAGSTASGSAIAESLLYVRYRANSVQCDGAPITPIFTTGCDHSRRKPNGALIAEIKIE
ncbi:hypothetical protein [Mycobacterium marinum]|uniref:hypothetical protein n=1 Tax=Mycobacterium marinum TaxID=1781 RepID=UPI001FB5E984|nr:hypothetical protein [Mycobacterium marinum]